MLINSDVNKDEFLVFETGFWWFAKTRYKKVGDHKNLVDIIGQYTWFLEKELDIEAKMRSLDIDNFAVQGELIGPGVQGNIYGLSDLDFYVYDLYRIKFGEYLLPEIRRGWVERLGLKHVPVLAAGKDLSVGTVDELLSWAEGKSELNPKQEREGIVFKAENSQFSFKAISNKYLIKQG